MIPTQSDRIVTDAAVQEHFVREGGSDQPEAVAVHDDLQTLSTWAAERYLLTDVGRTQ